MGIEKEIFILLGEFNQSSEVDEYAEDDIELAVSKYPNLHNLFQKYVEGKLTEIEANQLYFLIKNSKLILAALNKYYNEKMAEIVSNSLMKEDALSEVEVLIDRYQDHLISNFQLFSKYAIADMENENKKNLFICLSFSDVKFIFSIVYKEANFKTIDTLRVLAIPIDMEKEDKEKIFQCELQIQAGIIPLELRYNKPILLEDVVSIYSFKYESELYKFIQYRVISNDDIGYVIEYEGKEKNKDKFKKFLTNEIKSIFSNINLLLEIMSKNKYIKIIYNDKDILIPIANDSEDYIKEVVDYVCFEFGFN